MARSFAHACVLVSRRGAEPPIKAQLAVPYGQARIVVVYPACNLQSMGNRIFVIGASLSGIDALCELIAWVLEQMSIPSGFNCPDCRSALYEIKGSRLLRFRCRSGHAYSAQSLLSGQADSREAQLSSIFGALIEEVTLAKRMRAQLDSHSNPRLTKGLEDRAHVLEGEAAQVCTWLHEMAGLVEPEPSS